MENNDKVKINLPLLILAILISVGLFSSLQYNTDRLISQTDQIIKNCEKP